MFNLINLKKLKSMCVCIIMWRFFLGRQGSCKMRVQCCISYKVRAVASVSDNVSRFICPFFWERLGHSLCAKDVAHHVNCLDWHMKKQFVDFSCSFSNTAITMCDSCFWIWFVIPSDNKTWAILSCSARLHCPYCICFALSEFPLKKSGFVGISAGWRNQSQ